MYQKYVAIGRPIDDIKVNHTKKKVPVGNFKMAVDKKRTSKPVKIPCVVWEEKAEEYADLIRKGSLIHVEGEWNSYYFKGENGQEPFLQLEIDKVIVLDKEESQKE